MGGSSVFPIELSTAVASALERPGPDQREAVVLKIYQGFKFEEMADDPALTPSFRRSSPVFIPRSNSSSA